MADTGQLFSAYMVFCWSVGFVGWLVIMAMLPVSSILNTAGDTLEHVVHAMQCSYIQNVVFFCFFQCRVRVSCYVPKGQICWGSKNLQIQQI